MRDKQQIIQWESRQRKKYREGLLPLDQIKKLESLSDWQWEIDLKQESIDKACEIFKYAEKIGRLPKNREKNVDWVKTKKQAKVGKGNGTIWYPELEEIAKQHGFPNVFDISLKQKAIEQAHEIFKYAKKTGRLPKKEEKNVNWIQNKKQYKAGKGKGIWYPELDEIAKQYGFSNAFGLLDKKQEAIEQAHEVFKYANKTGRLPNYKEKNYNWIHAKKRAKAGKGNGTIWYPELEEIAQQYGFPNVFNKK